MRYIPWIAVAAANFIAPSSYAAQLVNEGSPASTLLWNGGWSVIFLLSFFFVLCPDTRKIPRVMRYILYIAPGTAWVTTMVTMDLKIDSASDAIGFLCVAAFMMYLIVRGVSHDLGSDGDTND